MFKKYIGVCKILFVFVVVSGEMVEGVMEILEWTFGKAKAGNASVTYSEVCDVNEID